MKYILLSALILFFVSSTIANTNDSTETKKSNKYYYWNKSALLVKFTTVDRPNERISFIVGIGATWVPQTLYQDPVINQSTNNVMIEKAQHLKTNLTLGITYTPNLYSYTDKDSKVHTVSRGISISTFINPITLSKVTETQSFFNIVDFGVGLGYKFLGGFQLMGTAEWFGVRQPRDWFVKEYENKNIPYIVNNAPQLTIDATDNSIFRTKIVTTIGFKMCYTFDIVKNYQAQNQ